MIAGQNDKNAERMDPSFLANLSGSQLSTLNSYLIIIILPANHSALFS